MPAVRHRLCRSFPLRTRLVRSFGEPRPRRGRPMSNDRRQPQIPEDDPPAPDGLSRREFLHPATAGGLAVAGGVAGAAPARAAEGEEPATVPVTLVVNGGKHELKLEPRVTLLDTLREHLKLTGTKKGCDHGQC